MVLISFYRCLYYVCFFFFFSSRRRHTRSDRDWSSDVCSSDLALEQDVARVAGVRDQLIQPVHRAQEGALAAARRSDQGGHGTPRNGDRDVEQRLGRAVPEAVGPDVENGRGDRRGTDGRPGHGGGWLVNWLQSDAHPNLPVMYASVCSFVGLVNSSSVRPIS